MSCIPKVSYCILTIFFGLYVALNPPGVSHEESFPYLINPVGVPEIILKASIGPVAPPPDIESTSIVIVFTVEPSNSEPDIVNLSPTW